MARPSQPPLAVGSTFKSARFPQVSTAPKPVSWGSVLLFIWALGCVCGACQLFRLQLQLSRLRIETHRPSSDLERLAKQIQVRLNVRQEVDVQISDGVTSPFVCGLSKPTIILPAVLAQALSPGELRALLNHEMAHLCQHDLVWCLAWRWRKVLCWFHPILSFGKFPPPTTSLVNRKPTASPRDNWRLKIPMSSCCPSSPCGCWLCRVWRRN
ncbi:MAG: M56 family metallopeptidase [Limisphaerales bacterium]